MTAGPVPEGRPEAAADGTARGGGEEGSRGGPGDRAAGGALVALGLAVAWQARTFEVDFLTDPLGPKALPLLAAFLVGAGGIGMVLRPGEAPAWPGRRGLALVGLALASFVVYAAALPATGFLLTTTLEIGFLSVLFGGRPLRSFVSAGAFSAALYLLFVNALGLSLPIGSLFLIGGP